MSTRDAASPAFVGEFFYEEMQRRLPDKLAQVHQTFRDEFRLIIPQDLPKILRTRPEFFPEDEKTLVFYSESNRFNPSQTELGLLQAAEYMPGQGAEYGTSLRMEAFYRGGVPLYREVVVAGEFRLPPPHSAVLTPTLVGRGTRFTKELAVGNVLIYNGTPFVVSEIESDQFGYVTPTPTNHDYNGFIPVLAREATIATSEAETLNYQCKLALWAAHLVILDIAASSNYIIELDGMAFANQRGENFPLTEYGQLRVRAFIS